MGYSLKVTLDCDGGCASCYEAAIRKRKRTPYNVNKILAAVDRIIEEDKRKSDAEREYSRPPTFHGGEPLLMRHDDFEAVAKKVFSHFGSNSIQTSGIHIDDRFVDIFKQYKFSIGVSIDGDTPALNLGRWSATPDRCEKMTALVLENIRKLRDAGLSVSIISLLRRYNAAPDRIDDFVRFLARMENDFDITWFRTNPVIVYCDDLRAEEEILDADLASALIKISDWTFQKPTRTTFPTRDFVELLFGYNNATCTFGECDVFATDSEHPINHVGEATNCLHGGAAVAGIQIGRADRKSKIRYEALRQTDQAVGGCFGCSYWHMCHGGCPGAGIDNDWRNRTRFCGAYKIFFAHLIRKLSGIIPTLIAPNHFYPDRVDDRHVQYDLRNGDRSTHRTKTKKTPKTVFREISKAEEKAPAKSISMRHVDRHGDKPHGDHTDQLRKKKGLK